ncbi:MAG: DUF4186 domain-containing protein [Deltaproteobacteria bacterium]
MHSCDAIFERLSRSAFRSGFLLSPADRTYLKDKTWETLERHARDFVKARLAPARPAKDGRQTPWRGHPVFVAQHATATCCRGCLARWHRIPKGVALSAAQQEYVVAIVMAWLEKAASAPSSNESPDGSRCA